MDGWTTWTYLFIHNWKLALLWYVALVVLVVVQQVRQARKESPYEFLYQLRKEFS